MSEPGTFGRGTFAFVRDFKGWAGHVLDLIGMTRFNLKNPRNYTKFRIIKSLKKKSKSKIFIEAGTYYGVTADRCSRIFDHVYTIELNPALAKKAADFLSPKKNIKVIEGNALMVLPELLGRSQVDDAFIYLDGHPCSSATSAGEIPEPAVEELAALSPYQKKINAVVIDDFRNFGVEKDFPEKSALLKIRLDFL